MGPSWNLLIIKAVFGDSCKMLFLMKATSDPLPETDIGRLVAMLTLMQLRSAAKCSVHFQTKRVTPSALPKANAFVLAS